MGTYKSILVGFDGSDSSKNALRQAARFAKKEGCLVTVVKALAPYEGELELLGVPMIDSVLREPAEDILSEATDIAKEEGVDIRTILEEGMVHDIIIDVARERDCDLIVLGRRGLARIARAFMGSVTARVIGHSPIDTLVVPKDTVLEWRNLLLATDGSPYSQNATEKALDIARGYGTDLKVLSVASMPDEAYGEFPDIVGLMIQRAQQIVDGVKKKAEGLGVKTDVFVRDGDAHRRIIELAVDVEAGVICMGSHGRTGLDRLLMGSVTEKVIGDAPCPVLIVKSY